MPACPVCGREMGKKHSDKRNDLPGRIVRYYYWMCWHCGYQKTRKNAGVLEVS